MAVSAIFVFKLILLESATVSLANLLVNIAEVSAIFTFKFSAAVALAISAAKSVPPIEIAFDISFDTDEPNALIRLDNETVSLANLLLNMLAVSAIFTFSASAVKALLFSALMEVSVFDLIA